MYPVAYIFLKGNDGLFSLVVEGSPKIFRPPRIWRPLGVLRVIAIFRYSWLPLDRQARVNFHAVERFKRDLLRTGRGKPIIERCLVLSTRVGAVKLPCLHVLDCCVRQHRMARDDLHIRRFSIISREDKAQLHDSCYPCLACQWRMSWYICGHQHRFALGCHGYGDSGSETKHSANTDDHRNAFQLKIVRWFPCFAARDCRYQAIALIEGF
jgi:hypothetical protein